MRCYENAVHQTLEFICISRLQADTYHKNKDVNNNYGSRVVRVCATDYKVRAVKTVSGSIPGRGIFFFFLYFSWPEMLLKHSPAHYLSIASGPIFF